jgi:3-hydroxymyristoyl/3-hydroxydecanoyl-(acyl carrier protein) dehydratase
MNQATLRQAIIECASSPVISSEEGCRWELCFKDDFVGFDGHFPGHPVLPAFVQILVTQCALQQRTGHAWALRRVKRAKFMKTVLPNQAVVLTWTEKALEAGLQGSFVLWVDDAKVASFSALYGPEGAADA